jgi:hypothetical protein
MKEVNFRTMKFPAEARDLINNIRAIRRGSPVFVDKEQLTQAQTIKLIVKYFKLNNERFKELIMMEYKDE